MEKFLAVGFKLFCVPAFLCLVTSIGYFAWRQNWNCAGLLAGILLGGPIGLALFMMPANLIGMSSMWIAKKGWRAITILVLFVNLVLLNACAAIATVAVFLAVVWYGFDTNHYWAIIAAFGAATFPGCWIALREKLAAGGLMLAFFAGATSSLMVMASLLMPALVIPSAIAVFLVALAFNWFFTAPKILPRKPRNALEAMIFEIYGNPPPPNSADPVQATRLASEQLKGVVSLDEVRRETLQLNSSDFPYTTHELALSVMLKFFKSQELVTSLANLQLQARMTALQWFSDGKINRMLLEAFENELYTRYKTSAGDAFAPNRL